MKNQKCSYIDCNNKAIGYFIGVNYGLWLCKKHKHGTLKQKVKHDMLYPLK